jgi:predicted nucleotidyltransferase component of viral defense system
LKGGTSLSKAHGLIRRFSEDIDITVLWARMDSNQAEKRLIDCTWGINARKG